MVPLFSKSPSVASQSFELKREDHTEKGAFVAIDVIRYNQLEGHLEHWLHPEERDYFHSLKAPSRRRTYLLGRTAAKTALQNLDITCNPPGVHIKTGIFKDPIPCFPMKNPIHVSISHTASMACALAFPAGHPMALDLEDIQLKRARVMKVHCEEDELRSLKQLGIEDDAASSIIWTAKEAVSKALRTGMTCPFALMKLKSIRADTNGSITGFFDNFAQYQFRSWIMDSRALTIVLPKRSELVFPSQAPKLS